MRFIPASLSLIRVLEHSSGRGCSVDINRFRRTNRVQGEYLRQTASCVLFRRRYHTPVYLSECCDYLQVEAGKVYVDCTLGGGGHTAEILRRGGRVIAIDRDLDSIKVVRSSLQEYIDKGDLEIFLDNFRNISTIVSASKLASQRGGRVDGVLMDLGVSSHQIDQPDRGFAFRLDGPLDMRMSRQQIESATINKIVQPTISSTEGIPAPAPLTAAEIVNKWSLTDIANVIYQYGEEQLSRQIAREIVASRPVVSTKDLADAIGRVVKLPHRQKSLARCFQALRIVVNDEMASLRELLLSLDAVVVDKGRIVALSYHSLEDRLVKNIIKDGYINQPGSSSTISSAINNSNNSSNSINSLSKSKNRIPKQREGTPAVSPWKAVFKRMNASDEEVDSNSRARSAKMRVAERQA